MAHPPESLEASADVQEIKPQFHMESLWAKAYKTVQDDEKNAKLLEKVEKLLSREESGGTQKPYAVLQGEERLRGIQVMAREQLEKLSETRATVTLGEKRFVVREYVEKAVQTIKQFKPIITGALSAEPHAAVAWACTLGVLSSLENIFQMDEDAAAGLNKILFIIIRYQHLQESVLSHDLDASGQTSTARQLFSNIEEKLVDIYVKVYIYQIQFLLRYGQGRVRRNLRGLLDPEQWKRQWKDIESSKQLIDEAVQARLAARTVEIWKSLDETEKTAGEILSTVKAIGIDLKEKSERDLLRSLKIAENAIFDSAKVQESVDSCLQGTQRQILNDIGSWAEDSSGQLIYWLHGMAGTGKSSIALTVANALKNGEPLTEGAATPTTAFLGASFFFKQGDATRNTTEKFFPTIAKGLAEQFGEFLSLLAQAIDENSTIGTKAPQQQLEHLIARPLSILDKEMGLPMRLIVVVDALDECTKTREAKDLVSMLSGPLRDLRRVQIRLLITSRSEEYITKSFDQLCKDSYRSVKLEKIKTATESDAIKDDITNYLSYRMRNIAVTHGVSPEDISESLITQLSRKSDGLFIYASTTCRFLDADDFDDEEARQERLDLILNSDAETDGSESDASDNEWANNAPQNQVDEIYRKVLSYPERGMAPNAKKKTYRCMKMILGFIAVLFEPLATSSLKEFLPSEADAMDNILKKLYAIVHVPDDEKLPLELIHLSFRDFILSKNRSRQLKFRVIEIDMHKEIFKRCIDIMTSMLRQDICGLVWPGTTDSEIPPSSLEDNIPLHLRYACRYWVDHLTELDHESQKDVGLLDNGAIHKFLQKFVLFWLEAMGLIKETATAILIINKLERLVNYLKYPLLSTLVYDMKRFALSNRWILDHAPLQIYLALIFNPEESPLRSLFEPLMPSWIVQKPKVDTQWTAELCVLQGHTDEVKSVEVSPDKTLVVSVSDSEMIIWDAITGTERFRFDQPMFCKCPTFSPDGRFIAVSYPEGPILVREYARGMEFLLEGHDDQVKHLVYSPKTGTMLASIAPLCSHTIRIWDIGSRRSSHVLSWDSPEKPYHCQFTPDEKFLLVGSSYKSVTMWDAKTGHCIRTLDGFSAGHKPQLAISADGSMVTMHSNKDSMVTFNLSTWEKKIEVPYNGSFGMVSMVPPTGNSIVYDPMKNEIMFLDAITASLETKFRISPQDNCVSISRDGDLLASGGSDYNVRLWDMQLGGQRRFIPDGRSYLDPTLQFSADRSLIIRHERLGQGTSLHDSTGKRLHLPFISFQRMRFSPDRELIALLTNNGNYQVWHKCMKKQVSIPRRCREIAFSPSNDCIAVVPTGGVTEIISRTTFQVIMRLLQSAVLHMLFSPDGQVFGLVYLDEKEGQHVLEIWNVPLQKLLWKDKHPDTNMRNFKIKFSPSSTFVTYRWSDSKSRAGERFWFIVNLAIEGEKRALVSGDEVLFHPRDNLMALGDELSITIKDTDSLITKQKFESVRSIGYRGSIAFTTTGHLASVLLWRQYDFTKSIVQLWDITNGAQIGEYAIHGNISHLSFSDKGYLLCDQGRPPLPSILANKDKQNLIAEQTDKQDLLFIGSHWLYYGRAKLMWFPAAFRSKVSILEEDTLAIYHTSGDIRVIKFNLAELPIRV